MRQHVSSGAPNINDDFQRRKIVRSSDGRRLCAMDANHRFAELARQLGVLREIIEHPRAKSLFHDRLAGLNRVLKLLKARGNGLGICGCAFAFHHAVSWHRRSRHLLLLSARAIPGQSVSTYHSESGDRQFFGTSLSLPWQSPDKSFASNKMWASHAL